VFLQELWGDATLSPSALYPPSSAPASSEHASQTPAGWNEAHAEDEMVGAGPGGGEAIVEVSKALDDLIVPSGTVRLAVHAGGAPVGVLILESADGRVSAARARATITAAFGVELMRVAVRDAIVGKPLMAPGTLRERLAHRTALAPPDS